MKFFAHKEACPENPKNKKLVLDGVSKGSEKVWPTAEKAPPVGGYVLYRADTRLPKKLLTDGGFKAWNPVSLELTRKLIKYALGVINVKPGMPNSGSQRYEVVGLDALAVQVKYNKDHETIQVSTDMTTDCGGQGSGSNIYKIKFDSLYLLDYRKKPYVSIKNPTFIQWEDMKNPLVVMDKPTLQLSSTIALSCTGEVFFLTTIPYSNLDEVKLSGKSTFKKVV